MGRVIGEFPAITSHLSSLQTAYYVVRSGTGLKLRDRPMQGAKYYHSSAHAASRSYKMVSRRVSTLTSECLPIVTYLASWKEETKCNCNSWISYHYVILMRLIVQCRINSPWFWSTGYKKFHTNTTSCSHSFTYSPFFGSTQTVSASPPFLSLLEAEDEIVNEIATTRRFSL